MEVNSSILPLSERNDDVLPNNEDKSKTFKQFKLHPLLIKSLRKLKYLYPSPVQSLSLPDGLCGKDLLIQAKSGTGKTVTFGLILLQDFLNNYRNRYSHTSHHLHDKNACNNTQKYNTKLTDPLNTPLDIIDNVLKSTAPLYTLNSSLSSSSVRDKSLYITETNDSNSKHSENEFDTKDSTKNELYELHSVVISPTRELAIQIADEIQRLGWYIQPIFKCVCLVGGVSAKEDRRKISIRPNLVVATPGRILGAVRRFRWMKSQKKNCKVFVLDEADLLLSHSFRGIIEFLIEFFVSDSTQILAVSATFPPPYVIYLEDLLATIDSYKNYKPKRKENFIEESSSYDFSNIFSRAMKLSSKKFSVPKTPNGSNENETFESDKLHNEKEHTQEQNDTENITQGVNTHLTDISKEDTEVIKRKFIKIILTASHKVSENYQNNEEGVKPDMMKKLSPILKGLKFCCIVIQDQPNELRERIVKLEALSEIFTLLQFQQAILFSNNPIEGMQLAQSFTKMGIPSEYTSSYLSQSDRVESFSSLKSGRCKLLVCSDVMSRGVDAIQVDLVINWDIPMDKETFIHRFGRAGRFGLNGYNITVCTQSDFPYFNYFYNCFDINFYSSNQFLDHLKEIITNNHTNDSRNKNLTQYTMEEHHSFDYQLMKLNLPCIPILGIMTSSHCCTLMDLSSFRFYLSITKNNSHPNAESYYLKILLSEKENMSPAETHLDSFNVFQAFKTNKSTINSVNEYPKNLRSYKSSTLSMKTFVDDALYTTPRKNPQPHKYICKDLSPLQEHRSLNDEIVLSEKDFVYQNNLNHTMGSNNTHGLENHELIEPITIFSKSLTNSPHCFQVKTSRNHLYFIYIYLDECDTISIPIYIPFTQLLYKTSTSYLIICLDRDITQYFKKNSAFLNNYKNDFYQSSRWQIFLDKIQEDLLHRTDLEDCKLLDYDEIFKKFLESPLNQLNELKDSHTHIWSL